MSALIINIITNEARFGGTATDMCRSPNAPSTSSTLLSPGPSLQSKDHPWSLYANQSPLESCWELRIRPKLQPQWSSALPEGAARDVGGGGGQGGGHGGPSATRGGSSSSTWAPATLLEMTPSSQLPAPLTHLV